MTTTTLRAAYTTWIQQDRPTRNWFRKTGYMSLYGLSGLTNMGIVWFGSPFPSTGANVVKATLTLRTRAVAGTGASQITAQLCAPWSNHFGTVTWNTRPAGKLAQVSLHKENPLAANQTWVFDVTEQMQAVASGEAFTGFVLSTQSLHQILVQGNMSSALDPSLSVEWQENPLPPTDLAPSTGQAVGTGSPILRWSFRDYVGGDVLASCQVRTGTSETTVHTAPSWDSGEVATTVPQLDLSAQSGWTPPAADTLVWWQVRCRDSSGVWSEWSDPVSWQWHPRLSVSLVQPEPTPSDQLGPELLANGGFESLDGWVTTGTVQQPSLGPTPPYAVIRGAGSLSQSVVLDPGASTTVTVSHQNDPDIGATVTVTPDVGNPVMAVMSVSGWDWLTTTVNLPAGASSATVTIAGTTGSTRVDNVTARQIVEGLPTSTFSDPTPVIQWATSGDMPQARWRASVSILDGSAWRVVAGSGTVVSAETSWTPDVGLADAGTVRIIVDVWDGRDREATPGTPVYASVSQEFAFAPTETVEIPSSIQVLDMAPAPSVMLRFTRSETPDRWDVYRDGMLLTSHPGLDFLVEGDQYEVTDQIAPNGEHTWTIFAIVNGEACKSQQRKATIRHPGTWLCDEDTGDKVCIVGGDEDLDLSMPEDRTSFTPIGSKARVDIISAQRGYEATHKGLLVGNPVTGQTAEEQLRILMGWRADVGRRLILLVSDMAFPVAVNNIQAWRTTQGATPRFPGDPGHVVQVSFDWHQTDWWNFGENS